MSPLPVPASLRLSEVADAYYMVVSDFIVRDPVDAFIDVWSDDTSSMQPRNTMYLQDKPRGLGFV
jgi:hypothetical protein